MLYASAAFLFLFLPLTLGIYTLVEERIRRYVLLVASMLFYVLANLRTPLAIPIIAAVAAITYFAGRYISRPGGIAITYIVVSANIAAFFTLRIIYEAGDGGILFPLGAAVYLLMSVSYLLDIKRGDCEPGSIVDTVLYLSFFPLMAAGPIVKYRDFVKYINNIKLNTINFADGAKLYMTGFIECIAVAAVMREAYITVIEASGHSVNIIQACLAAALVLLSTFFAIAGWTDMGVGISMMFGIMIPRDCGFAPGAQTPLGYFSRIFRGLRDWLDDYLISPFKILTGFSDKLSAAVGGAIIVIGISLWIKTTVTMFLAALILALITLLLSLSGVERMFREKRYLRPLGWLITTLIMAIFWIAVTASGTYDIFTFLRLLEFSLIDFRTYYLFISLSGGKFIFVAAAALLLLTPLSFYGKQLTTRVPRRLGTFFETVCMLALLAAFVFTIMFFMPQYPLYAVRVFDCFVF